MSKVIGRVSGQPYDRSTFEVRNEFLGSPVTGADMVDRSPLKIRVQGRTTVKTKAETRAPRNRCTWDGSVPSVLNHSMNSRIGR